jgi:hypothetical protein
MAGFEVTPRGRFCPDPRGTHIKGSRSKVEAILTVLYVVTKCILHGGNKMDRVHICERSFDVPVLSKIGKHLYSEHRMLAPAIARPIHRLIRDAILL